MKVSKRSTEGAVLNVEEQLKDAIDKLEERRDKLLNEVKISHEWWSEKWIRQTELEIALKVLKQIKHPLQIIQDEIGDSDDTTRDNDPR